MNLNVTTKATIEKPDESFEPEIFDLEVITDFDSFDERLKEVQDDYDAACDAFRKANPNKRTIMDEAAKVEKAARVLIGRLLNAFHGSEFTGHRPG